MKFSQLSLFAPVRALFVQRGRKTAVRARGSEERSHDPELHRLWCAVRRDFFPDRPDIDGYMVYWSRRRQKRTLASCNVRAQRVSVARELNHPHHSMWLEPLLYHEMCHAVLGMEVERRGRKRQWHGRSFRALECRHPRMREFDRWVKSGGWLRAVRSERSRSAARRRARAR